MLTESRQAARPSRELSCLQLNKLGVSGLEDNLSQVASAHGHSQLQLLGGGLQAETEATAFRPSSLSFSQASGALDHLEPLACPHTANLGACQCIMPVDGHRWFRTLSRALGDTIPFRSKQASASFV